mgnify:CR=1 FL=1
MVTKTTHRPSADSLSRRIHISDGQFRTERPSDYALPDFDTISYMRIELMHNLPGSHKPEWVLKFFISYASKPEYIDTHNLQTGVFFNLSSGAQIERTTAKAQETDSFKATYLHRVGNEQAKLAADKAARPRGMKKNTRHVCDHVIAGFCTVKKAPWGTVVIPQQQAIITPYTRTDAESGEMQFRATLWLNQNNVRQRQVVLHDVRKPGRAPNASVMVGYYDGVGFGTWRASQSKKAAVLQP